MNLNSLFFETGTGKGRIQPWLLFLFLLAVLVKSVLLRTYLYIDGDRSLQLVAAAEWAKGFGYTVPQVELGNINLVRHKVLLEWPPLYSGLLVPLLKLTGFNFSRSSCILDSTGAFFYLLAIWRLMQLLGFSPFAQMIAVWFKATEIYEGFFNSFPTDFLAAACWLWAFYFFLKYLDEPQNKWLVTLLLCIGASFLFRYVYLTALPVLPLLLWWSGFRKNRADWMKAGVILALGLAIIVMAYLGFNKVQTGTFTYLEQWDKGFYPGKLVNTIPLFWQAISHVTFICVQFELLFHTQYRFFYGILQFSSAAFLTYMLIRWLQRAWLAKFVLGNDRMARFVLSAVMVCSVIIATLAALSIRIDFPVDITGGTWSYMVEDRYFLIPLTIILFVIMGQLFLVYWKHLRLQGFLRKVLILACLFQVVHIGWILEKRIPLIKMEDPANPRDALEKRGSLQAMFNEGKGRGDDVVLFSKEYGYIYYALANNVKVFRQVSAMGDSAIIGIKTPSTIVVSLKENEFKKYKVFLEKYQFKVRRRFLDEVHLIGFVKPAGS
ncbi:glycosyltransferase family 39 protein [Flavihumibacter profundi]|uniref:glycosyltransferase family 39 protein n=1 Tax=Flavihumibacter profundi TaxID=2716883 RepID=UPI001CC6F98C|nr:hypothetical protein [Flavihumibacter profundi]MBZ5857452.1 hypothetical protein [Flavihumibacter profundi]